MGLEDLKIGDLILFTRHNSYPNLSKVSAGIFLGSKSDLTPSRMDTYTRIYMFELGGRFFSLLFWAEKDKIEKIE